MKIKLWVQAIDLKAFLTGESKTLSAYVYQDTPYNVEIEVDTSRMKLKPEGCGNTGSFYTLSRRAGGASVR